MTAAAGAWQPMETAPLDGSVVLLFLPGSALCEFTVAEYRDDDADYPGGAWWEAVGEPGYPIDLEPSHWAPLFDPGAA